MDPAPAINDDNYAKVFVSSSQDRESLADLLCGFSEAAKRNQFSQINTNEISVDVRRNEDYDPEKNEFINFRYYLDVNSVAGLDQERFLGALTKLVVFIKKQCLPVVTACDDEVRLAQLVEKELTA